jgi:hypothetical protein
MRVVCRMLKMDEKRIDIHLSIVAHSENYYVEQNSSKCSAMHEMKFWCWSEETRSEAKMNPASLTVSGQGPMIPD